MNITIKVAAVIKNDKQQVLLTREKYVEKFDFKWNLVKGTYDDADETIEDCIKREVAEEVGLRNIDVLSLNGVFHYGTKQEPKVLFVFNVFCKEETVNTKNNKPDESISEIRWFSKDDLFTLKKEDYMADYVYESLKNHGEKIIVKKI